MTLAGVVPDEFCVQACLLTDCNGEDWAEKRRSRLIPTGRECHRAMRMRIEKHYGGEIYREKYDEDLEVHYDGSFEER